MSGTFERLTDERMRCPSLVIQSGHPRSTTAAVTAAGTRTSSNSFAHYSGSSRAARKTRTVASATAVLIRRERPRDRRRGPPRWRSPRPLARRGRRGAATRRHRPARRRVRARSFRPDSVSDGDGYERGHVIRSLDPFELGTAHHGRGSSSKPVDIRSLTNSASPSPSRRGNTTSPFQSRIPRGRSVGYRRSLTSARGRSIPRDSRTRSRNTTRVRSTTVGSTRIWMPSSRRASSTRANATGEPTHMH